MSKHVTLRFGKGSVSFQIDTKTIGILLLLIGLSLLLFMVGLCVGSTFIHPLVVVKHLFGMGSG